MGRWRIIRIVKIVQLVRPNTENHGTIWATTCDVTASVVLTRKHPAARHGISGVPRLAQSYDAVEPVHAAGCTMLKEI